jgi:hypothetical protein
MSVCLSVCLSVWNKSDPTGEILMILSIWAFFLKNLSRNFKFYSNPNRITVLFMKTFRHLWQYLAELSLQWEMFRTKIVYKMKTHILCSITFFSENRAVYEIMSKNMVEPERPQMTIWRRVAYWISKATRTQTRVSVCALTPTHERTNIHWHPHALSFSFSLSRAHARTHSHTRTEICNSYYFSTETVVSEMRLYMHCLSCYHLYSH